MQSCAVLLDGTAYCWGDNTFKQLGYSNPLAVGDDELPRDAGALRLGAGLTELALGQARTCALYADGSARCWGLNSNGQLGYGNTATIPSGTFPEALPTLQLPGPAARLFAGNQQTCAVLESGGLSCWGANLAGQLGFAHRNNVGDDETPLGAGLVPLHAQSEPSWIFFNPHNLEVWLEQRANGFRAVSPAVFVVNRGEAALSQFSALYSFRDGVSPAFVPHLRDTWTPWSTPRLQAENTRGLYSLLFDFGDSVLDSGRASSLGVRGGERVQLRLDQGPWIAEDDYSVADMAKDATWHLTTRVQLLGPSDTVLYGWTRPAD